MNEREHEDASATAGEGESATDFIESESQSLVKGCEGID